MDMGWSAAPGGGVRLGGGGWGGGGLGGRRSGGGGGRGGGGWRVRQRGGGGGWGDYVWWGAEAAAVVVEGLTAVVWSLEQVGWLAAAAERFAGGRILRVHVEVDSGMTRQGVRPGGDLGELVEAIQAGGSLRLDGALRLEG